MTVSRRTGASSRLATRWCALLLAVATTLAGAPAAATPAAASPTTSHETTTTSTTLVGAAPSGVPLAPPDADEAGRRRAATDLHQARRELFAAVRTHRRAARRVPPLQRREAAAQGRMESLTAEERAAAAALEKARQELRRLAVAGYVSSGHASPMNFLLEARDPNDLSRRRALVESATDARFEAVQAYEAAKREVTARLEAAVRELEEVRVELRHAQTEVDVLAAQVEAKRAEVENRRQLLDLVTAAAPVVPTDIPRLFLDAYRRAADLMRARWPGCRVRWWALAAIGRVEANHGRFKGARLTLSGDIHPPIIGIALDGTRSALIRDTDQGAYDGDVEYDRAVGPMQFIPSTWKRVARDGNGDGAISPHNAYDATATAAVYLCRAVPAGGLDVDENLRRAVFSYNRSNAYVDVVVAIGRRYEAALPGL